MRLFNTGDARQRLQRRQVQKRPIHARLCFTATFGHRLRFDQASGLSEGGIVYVQYGAFRPVEPVGISKKGYVESTNQNGRKPVWRHLRTVGAEMPSCSPHRRCLIWRAMCH